MAKHHHQSRRRKTIRITNKKEEDYISLLPDCLLIDIISRLPETEEAIRTGTLSKRWQHLWPYVNNLIFIDHDYYHHLRENFVSLVNKTLTQCRQSNLHKFQIRSSYNVQFASQFNNWIRYAVTRNVLDLELYLTESVAVDLVLDQFMFINSCLTHLKLGRCVFNPTGAISWTKLTTLSLSDAYLSEDLIQNILSGSPLLETLELDHCSGFRHIDITSKSVQNFVFSVYEDFRFADVIEINAPYILSLTIADTMWLSKLLLVDVSCLVKAHLDYENYRHFDPTFEVLHEEMLKGLILSLRNVKELKIGKSCSKVLSRLEAKGFIFPSILKVVDVTSPLSYDTDSDSLELADTSHSDSSESDDSEGIVEPVLGTCTCAAHNC